MPKVARETGSAPNQGILAAVAAPTVDDVQLLPLTLFRLSVKSTLPLLPAPGLLKLK